MNFVTIFSIDKHTHAHKLIEKKNVEKSFWCRPRLVYRTPPNRASKRASGSDFPLRVGVIHTCAIVLACSHAEVYGTETNNAGMREGENDPSAIVWHRNAC